MAVVQFRNEQSLQFSNTVNTFENVFCLAYEMRLFSMFITIVCVLFLIKLPWPKKEFIERAYLGAKERANRVHD